jgi:integrase
MPRDWTVREVEVCRTPGDHRVSRNLYLHVSAAGAKSWLFRYIYAGQSHWLGLGSLAVVSLHDARDQVIDQPRLLAQGIDPLAHKRTNGHARSIPGAAKTQPKTGRTFAECAEEYISRHEKAWRGRKTAQAARQRIRDYANPVIGRIDVAQITSDHVRQILEPIWPTKTKTAIFVREAIEHVLNYAKASGLRTGENPARWKGHLELMLPRPSKVWKEEPRKALPYRDVPAFISALRVPPQRRHPSEIAVATTTRRLLEFLILTALRTGEGRFMRWSEIDLERRLLSISADRMKGCESHDVPLCDRAVEILEEMAALHGTDGHVFKGRDSKHKPVGARSCHQVLEDMGLKATVDVHGFRSSFRDWAAEETEYPNHVCEMALAHKIPNAVEAAYRRGNLLAKRRELMRDWEAYCCSAPRTPTLSIVPESPRRRAHA